MADSLREILYPVVFVMLLATLWVVASSQSVIAQAQRTSWPASDPLLVQRAMHAGQANSQPNAVAVGEAGN